MRRRRYIVVYKYFVWEIFTAEGLELKEAHQSLLPDLLADHQEYG